MGVNSATIYRAGLKEESMGFGRKKIGFGARNQFLPMWRCKACGKRFDAPARKGF